MLVLQIIFSLITLNLCQGIAYVACLACSSSVISRAHGVEIKL